MPIEVKCVGGKNKCIGRNGAFVICSVTVEGDGNRFEVKGVSSRLHRSLNGGFVLDGETLDRLATEWLRQRGKKAGGAGERWNATVVRHRLKELLDLLAGDMFDAVPDGDRT